MEEEWRAVVGYEGVYEVSSAGRVRRMTTITNTKAGRVLKNTRHRLGYLMVNLSNGKATMHLVHRLVCRAFYGAAPKGMTDVAHGDGNPKNNALSNLRWATPSDNHADKHLHGTMPIGNSHPRCRHTDQDVVRMFELRAAGTLIDDIAKEFGTHRSHVTGILSRRIRHRVEIPESLIAAANRVDGRKKCTIQK